MTRTETTERSRRSRFTRRRFRTRTPIDSKTAEALRAELDAIVDHRAWDGAG